MFSTYLKTLVIPFTILKRYFVCVLLFYRCPLNKISHLSSLINKCKPRQIYGRECGLGVLLNLNVFKNTCGWKWFVWKNYKNHRFCLELDNTVIENKIQKNNDSKLYHFLALLKLRFDYILLLSVSLIQRVYKNRTNLKSLSMFAKRLEVWRGGFISIDCDYLK